MAIYHIFHCWFFVFCLLYVLCSCCWKHLFLQEWQMQKWNEKLSIYVTLFACANPLTWFCFFFFICLTLFRINISLQFSFIDRFICWEYNQKWCWIRLNMVMDFMIRFFTVAAYSSKNKHFLSNDSVDFFVQPIFEEIQQNLCTEKQR